MDPLAIALGITLLWTVVGLGLFLIFTGFLGLVKSPAVPRVAGKGSPRVVRLRSVFAVLLGLALTVGSGCALFIVIYH